MAGKKTILRWAMRFGVAVIAAALLLIIVVKFWIAPAIIRWQVDAAVSDYWNGWTSIDEIRFNYTAPIILRGLSLHDQTGRRWLDINAVELTLRGWPGTAPALTKVEIFGFRGTAYFVEGRCIPPTRTTPEREKRNLSKYMDLQEVLINDGSIAFANEHGDRYQTSALRLRLNRAGEQFIITVEPMVASPGWASPLQDISIDQTDREFIATVKLDRQIKEDDMRTILKIIRVPRVQTAAGKLAVDVKLSGRLDEPNSIAAKGTIALTDWQLVTEHGQLAENLNANLQIETAGDIRLRSGDLRADVCNGSLKAELAVMLQPGPLGKIFKYEGKVEIANVSMELLNRALTDQTDMRTGLLSGSGSFSGFGGQLEALQVSNGQILATNVDLAGGNPLARLFQSIFKLADIDLGHAVGANNIAAKFTVDGAIAKFDSGRASNSIWAIDLEPAGRVNISTSQPHADLPPKHIDLRMIVIPVAMMDKVFYVVLPPVTDLAKKLSRVHVTGPWDKPTISKETIKDLQEGTIDFIRQILLSHDQLGPNVTDTVNRILDILKDSRKSPDKSSDK